MLEAVSYPIAIVAGSLSESTCSIKRSYCGHSSVLVQMVLFSALILSSQHQDVPRRADVKSVIYLRPRGDQVLGRIAIIMSGSE